MHISLADLGTSSATLDQEQAVAVIGLGAVSSDGNVEKEELAGLLTELARLGVAADDEARERLVWDIVELAKQHGLGPLTGTALATLAGDRREAALRLAFAVSMSDGELPDEELRYVGELQAALGISDQRYDELLAEC